MSDFNGLDFETYGEVNLPKKGLDNYVNDPSFKPLIAAFTDHTGITVAYDFVLGGVKAEGRFLEVVRQHAEGLNEYVAAHNAGFERAVLRRMNAFRNERTYDNIVDSAVTARAMGAGSKLEAAAPQLLGTDKLEDGRRLIMKFSVPNEWNGGHAPTPALINSSPEHQADWDLFFEYCALDSQLSRRLVDEYQWQYNWHREHEYETLVTARQNNRGWPVDMKAVHEMQLRYHDNVEQVLSNFRALYPTTGEPLNFSSNKQLQEWCSARGVRAKSFDSDNVEDLIKKIDKKLRGMEPMDPKYDDYEAVLTMLETKKELGGATLNKLQTIIDLTGSDGRLRNQYVHLGAGQTYRSTALGVQLQNLKRLGQTMLDMDNIDDPGKEYSNGDLAENLRQVFTSSHPDGSLIVADYSSVESRGLAWIAGAGWKIEAYAQGKDMYKVLAAGIYNIAYEDVTSEQRRTGKLGELSCGYGAGPVAVQKFAKGMGIEMTEAGALQIVRDWREANPEVVELWYSIDDALKNALRVGSSAVYLHSNDYGKIPNDLRLAFNVIQTPQSLAVLHPGALSMRVQLTDTEGIILQRVFHGCYLRGRDICFYKPTATKSGPVWTSQFTNAATNRKEFYKIYGGKLTGIIVQSMCRELFFYGSKETELALRGVENANLIGQFHDELVTDYVPGTVTQQYVEQMIADNMTARRTSFAGFPLAVDVKASYRYIK